MTKEYRNNLSESQTQALPIFASNSCVEESCDLAGISRTCYYAWMKQPCFSEELNKLRNELIEGAVIELKINTKKAVETLVDLLDRQECPSVQRAAANDILNQAMKFQELIEMEKRVSKLEQLQS